MSNYGYARVSSTDQNEARQIESLINAGCSKIYLDKQSGKDFERPEYQKMIRALRDGDVVFVHSLDRLGRNYELIKEQWEYITKKKKADIVVLDMPLLDTRKDKNLVGMFIADLVLQVLSFVSQMERENIRKRQAEGIRLAMQRGVKFGRVEKPVPEGFEEMCKSVRSGSMSLSGASRSLEMSRSTFITKYRIWEASQNYEPKQFGMDTRELAICQTVLCPFMKNISVAKWLALWNFQKNQA